MAEYGYTVPFEPLEEGGYQVIVPALLGIVAYGRTLSEAREMASDAIVFHIRGLLKDNEEEPFAAAPLGEEKISRSPSDPTDTFGNDHRRRDSSK